jgi:hypothetical protein
MFVDDLDVLFRAADLTRRHGLETAAASQNHAQQPEPQ